jgi:hypothetical protein
VSIEPASSLDDGMLLTLTGTNWSRPRIALYWCAAPGSDGSVACDFGGVINVVDPNENGSWSTTVRTHRFIRTVDSDIDCARSRCLVAAGYIRSVDDFDVVATADLVFSDLSTTVHDTHVVASRDRELSDGQRIDVSIVSATPATGATAIAECLGGARSCVVLGTTPGSGQPGSMILHRYLHRDGKVIDCATARHL